MQFLEHPVSVHPLLLGVIQDVDSSRRRAELAGDGITHVRFASTPPASRRRALLHPHTRAWPQFIGTALGDFVAGLEVTEHFHQRP
jgi:hypothetical protein